VNEANIHELAGRRAVVTGAASGIGAAIAEVFVARGAQVMLCDIDGSVAKVAAELGAESVVCDVTSESDVRATIEACVQAFGGIEILVNNAGIEGNWAKLADATGDDVDAVFAVNVKGVLYGIKHASAVMPRGGSIINIASLAAVRAAPLLGVYGAAKAASVSLTQTAALELRSAGIRVNAVLPSYTSTPRGDKALAVLDTPGQNHELAIKKSQGRMAQASEVAEVVAFLGSKRASFVSGQVVSVDNAASTRFV
jgi:NAD(P)-dependent dehydrogenase (short-subunit alcohol dehydrogenase family)